jgi:hypothetical protein
LLLAGAPLSGTPVFSGEDALSISLVAGRAFDAFSFAFVPEASPGTGGFFVSPPCAWANVGKLNPKANMEIAIEVWNLPMCRLRCELLFGSVMTSLRLIMLKRQRAGAA